MKESWKNQQINKSTNYLLEQQIICWSNKLFAETTNYLLGQQIVCWGNKLLAEQFLVRISRCESSQYTIKLNKLKAHSKSSLRAKSSLAAKPDSKVSVLEIIQNLKEFLSGGWGQNLIKAIPYWNSIQPSRNSSLATNARI